MVSLTLLATVAVSEVGAASLAFAPVVATSKAQVVAAVAKDPHANLFSGRMQATQVNYPPSYMWAYILGLSLQNRISHTSHFASLRRITASSPPNPTSCRRNPQPT